MRERLLVLKERWTTVEMSRSQSFDEALADMVLQGLVDSPAIFFATDEQGSLLLVRGNDPQLLPPSSRAFEIGVGRSLFEIFVDQVAAVEAVGAALAGKITYAAYEVRPGLRAGLWCAPLPAQPDSPRGICGMIRTFEASEAGTQALDFSGKTEPITGLANRWTFLRDADALIASAVDARFEPVCMAVFDLLDLRSIRAAFGPEAEDSVLRAAGNRVVGLFEGSTAVFGSVAFHQLVVAFPVALGSPRMLRKIQRTASALERPYQIEGNEFVTSVNVGYSMYPGHGSDAMALFRKALAALHVAEHQSSSIIGYSRAWPSQADNLLLLNEGRSALAAGREFEMYFQPLQKAGSRTVESFEALVRWNHPRLGLLAPATFIPLFEGSTLIHALTAFTLNASIRQVRIWEDAGLSVAVAVNLSPAVLSDDAIGSSMRQILETWGVSGEQVIVEVTEQALVEDPVSTRQFLTSLAEIGVRCIADDFGTGYSNFAALRTLPLQGIKLDRSLMTGIDSSPTARKVAHAICALAKDLALSVTLEGVETPSEWDAARGLGADTIQGYHIAHPMPADAVVDWIKNSL